jgi:hypothetical protein
LNVAVTGRVSATTPGSVDSARKARSAAKVRKGITCRLLRSPWCERRIRGLERRYDERSKRRR